MAKASVVLAMALSAVAPLRADIITATILTTITSGVDNAALFGPQGADLTGKSATLQFTLDRSLILSPGHGSYTSVPNLQEELANASIVGDGALSNTITINGISFTVTQAAGGDERFLSRQDGTGSFVQSLIFNHTTGIGSDFRLTGSTPYQFPILDPAHSNPQAFIDLVTSTLTKIEAGLDLEQGAFQDDLVFKVTAAPTSTVPEPSSIVLLLSVLGSVYLIGRRQRSFVAAARGQGAAPPFQAPVAPPGKASFPAVRSHTPSDRS